jgi:hypothetical protein
MHPNGNPIPVLGIRELRRFLRKVRIDDFDGCWEWQGRRDRQGYGLFTLKTVAKSKPFAHRIAYALTRYGLPSEMWVLHLCDNPGCVNPMHLMAGSRDDNERHKRIRETRVGHTYVRYAVSVETGARIWRDYQRGETIGALGEHYGYSRQIIARLIRRLEG